MLSKHHLRSIRHYLLQQKARKLIALRAFLLVFFCLISSGCNQFTPSHNLFQTAQTLANTNLWQEFNVVNTSLPVQAILKTDHSTTELLRIYIEGDGRAWLNRHTPTADPTPHNPVALRLALQDTTLKVAYLARPCQFTPAQYQGICTSNNWTKGRFSPEIIRVIDSVVSQLKKESSANKIALIGYSGGGAVATLIAAKRDDVALLVTVAGVLDHVKWTELKQVSPLSGSLNPIDNLEKLTGVQQIHFVGGKDNIVPLEITHSYVERSASSLVKMVILPDQGHSCCWESIWSKLLVDYL